MTIGTRVRVKDLQVGDVLSFMGHRAVVTHRPRKTWEKFHVGAVLEPSVPCNPFPAFMKVNTKPSPTTLVYHDNDVITYLVRDGEVIQDLWEPCPKCGEKCETRFSGSHSFAFCSMHGKFEPWQLEVIE